MNTDKKMKLSKRQLAVIEDLFDGEIEEQAVLDKYRVSRRLYNKWLADSNFAGEFDRRIDAAYRQSAVLIARYAPLAAAKLVQLTDSKNQETARKACLDIISMHASREARDDGRGTKDETEPAESPPQSELSDQTASQLLATLAEEKQRY